MNCFRYKVLSRSRYRKAILISALIIKVLIFLCISKALKAQCSDSWTNGQYSDETNITAGSNSHINFFNPQEIARYDKYPLVNSNDGYYFILSIKNDLFLHFNKNGELANSSIKAIDRYIKNPIQSTDASRILSQQKSKQENKEIKNPEKNTSQNVMNKHIKSHQKKQVQNNEQEDHPKLSCKKY